MPGPGIGPLGEEGAVEPLYLPVGLGPVLADVGMLDLAERLVERVALVAGAVVGQHSFHVDSKVSEEGGGSRPEAGGGRALFVGEDFAVGHSAVRIDGRVHKGVTRLLLFD